MSEHFQRLQRLLPERTAPGSNALTRGTKALRDWLDHLPYANPNLAAIRLMGALNELNASKLEPQQRLDALELLRRPIQDIVDGLNKQMQSDAFPMTAAKLQAGETAHDFERELAMGYLAVVCDQCAPNGKLPFLRGKIVALALTRAIQHQGARLWNAYQLHCTPIVGVWQCLHDMFLFAVDVRCDEKADADALTGGAKISPRSAYMQALLHAFAKPYHFTQKENAELRAALPAMASLCDIRPGYAPEGAIAVCTDGDRSPPGPPRGRQAPIESLWQLDMSVLRSSLETGLAARREDQRSVQVASRAGARAELSGMLAERLVKIWGGRGERASLRSTEHVVLDTVLGLQGVHFVLSNNVDFDTFQRRAHETDQDGPVDGRAQIWASAEQSSERARHARAQTLDRGIGGYRLRWDRSEEVRARVGELIALASTESETHEWAVGVLRWLRVDALGAVEAGVEILSRHARAVSVRSLDANGLPRAPMRGMLVVPTQADAAGQVQPYIIVPHLFDREAIAVELTRFDESSLHGRARVETISDMHIRDRGGLYLQIVLPLQMIDRESATSAANDDHSAKFVLFPQRKA